MSRLVLADDVHLHVDHADETPFGSAVSSRAEQLVRKLYRPVLDRIRQEGYALTMLDAPRMLRDIVDSPAFGRVAEKDGAMWRLRPELLWPEASSVRPRTMTAARPNGGEGVRFDVADAEWPTVHDFFARLADADVRPAWLASRPDWLTSLVAQMAKAKLVHITDEPSPAAEALCQPGLAMLGHNTVLLRTARVGILTDPLLFADHPEDPPGYAPVQRRHLGAVDAILLTHSHPDHFDLASLLRFSPDTTFVVPHVLRESILSCDMAQRLRNLGFGKVVELDWWQSTIIGDVTVTALPFYGEQPTAEEVLHPEVRNIGCTFHLAAPEQTVVLLADSGRDHLGDAKILATQARTKLGPVDVVFGGYRGWTTYPAQLLTSSVARYLLFVPPHLWAARHSLMTTADDAIDIAERWGAHTLIPYGDGGAPWHWRIGLGPRLDGTGEEIPGFDPLPERVAEAAARRAYAPDRGYIHSSVTVRILRPNDVLRPDAWQVERIAGRCWPQHW